MRTKTIVFAFALMLAGMATFAQKSEVNTEKSTIEWLGKKIGGQHDGFISVKSGYLESSDDKISAGKIIVDMTSITNTDLKDDGLNQRLVGHLKSDDFFGVETYPTAKFVVTESSKFSSGKARLKGDITIKGKTETIEFDVEREGNVYTATIDLDRSKFDVRYGSKSFFDNLGDKAINDIFNLKIKLVVN